MVWDADEQGMQVREEGQYGTWTFVYDTPAADAEAESPEAHVVRRSAVRVLLRSRGWHRSALLGWRLVYGVAITSYALRCLLRGHLEFSAGIPAGWLMVGGVGSLVVVLGGLVTSWQVVRRLALANDAAACLVPLCQCTWDAWVSRVPGAEIGEALAWSILFNYPLLPLVMEGIIVGGGVGYAWRRVANWFRVDGEGN